MKKKLYILPLLVAALTTVGVSCSTDDDWNNYAEWREANEAWLQEQRTILNPDGSEFYTRLSPEWNRQGYVLIHYFNDRSETEGNLSPYFNSTVNVKYKGRLYNDIAFDSSYKMVDSLFTCRPQDVISGWSTALQDMRVGDSARVVIPWQSAYGASGQGMIPPYSVLQFDIKMVDMVSWEKK